jgi:transcriptional regulator with XRE-family HTH domain
MSFIGKNIRKIRTVKKLSQATFAELFGLARPSVGAYEEGRSEPKIDTLIQIAQHFGLSLDLLLTKELTINELYHFDIFKEQLPSAPSIPKTAGVKPEQDRTPLVYADWAPAYIAQRHDPAFVQTLPVLQLPHQLPGPTRAFEVAGAAMQLHGQGLRPQDIVLCCRVEDAQPSLQVGRVYAFVLPDQLLIRRLVGRLLNGEMLQLRADNPSYGPQDLDLAQALEMWEVRGVFTTHLQAPNLLHERVTALEQKLEDLARRLSD